MSSMFARSSGLLLHLTSLPARPLGSISDDKPGTDGAWSAGDVGSGDLGPSAYEFVRFLKQAGQRWWQILPTGPTGYGFSPYQSPSSFAGNPLLISPALLVRDGLLRLEEWHDAARSSSPSSVHCWSSANFEVSSSKRMELLRIAFRRFQNQRSELNLLLDDFRQSNEDWLEEHCLFIACKNFHNDRAWSDWEVPLKRREQQAL